VVSALAPTPCAAIAKAIWPAWAAADPTGAAAAVRRVLDGLPVGRAASFAEAERIRALAARHAESTGRRLPS
jgi:hypothetical protein